MIHKSDTYTKNSKKDFALVNQIFLMMDLIKYLSNIFSLSPFFFFKILPVRQHIQKKNNTIQEVIISIKCAVWCLSCYILSGRRGNQGSWGRRKKNVDSVIWEVKRHFSASQLIEGGLVLLWEQHKVHKSKEYFSTVCHVRNWRNIRGLTQHYLLWVTTPYSHR